MPSQQCINCGTEIFFSGRKGGELVPLAKGFRLAGFLGMLVVPALMIFVLTFFGFADGRFENPAKALAYWIVLGIILPPALGMFLCELVPKRRQVRCRKCGFDNRI